jgi:ABC-2 type transport system ATP-binding protein
VEDAVRERAGAQVQVARLLGRPSGRDPDRRRLRLVDVPLRAVIRRRLEREEATVRRSGAELVSFLPTPADPAAMGNNPMDPGRRAAVTGQAYESTLALQGDPNARMRLGALGWSVAGAAALAQWLQQLAIRLPQCAVGARRPSAARRCCPLVIEVSHLVKTYAGRTPVRAVRGVSFQVERGEIFGFLGPNGAGKTTTIRCMLDLIRPTSGTITVFGLDSRRDSLAIHQRIGYLPGDVRLPGDLTARQFLDRYSRIAGLEPVLLPSLLQRFEVPLNRKLKGFSKGMRQMVAILQAFMCDPELVILDEPTSGLDPLGQRTFNEFLVDETHQGRTVFMSSHNLSEVEKTCRRVGVIRGGELVAVEAVEQLRERGGQVVIVEFADGVLEAELRAIPTVQSVEARPNGAYHLKVAGSIDPVIKLLARHTVRRLEVEEAPLEEVFLRFYADGGGGPRPVALSATERGGPV